MIAHKLYTEGMIELDEEIGFNQYWIAALLHDVGKLVLGLFFPKYFDNVLSRMSPDAEFGRDFREAEVGRVGLHEDIGRLLLLKADAGEPLVDAVGAHHASAPEPGALVSLLHLSNNLCKDLGLGYLPEEKGAYSPAVLQKLDLDESNVKKLKDQLGENMVRQIEDVVDRSTAEKKGRENRSSSRGSREAAFCRRIRHHGSRRRISGHYGRPGGQHAGTPGRIPIYRRRIAPRPTGRRRGIAHPIAPQDHQPPGGHGFARSLC